jgi:ketosteroid isomerase-like protein
MDVQTSLGAEFAQAIAAKDADRLRALLHPDVDFKGLTPRRVWEAGTPDEVAAVVFDNWFEPSDDIEGVEHVDTDAFADRERVGYRFRVRNADGAHVVEQQAYFTAGDGRISWMRVVCSGFRPAG